MDHGGEDELELVGAEGEGVAVLHLVKAGGQAVEAGHHVEGLLIADNLDIGIELAQQGQRAAVVGLHVVDDDVVDGTVADDLADVLEEGHEEVDLDSVDEADFLVVDEVGVIAHAVGEGPKALEERLVAVVDADVVDFAGDFFHIVGVIYGLDGQCGVIGGGASWRRSRGRCCCSASGSSWPRRLGRRP